MKKKELKVKAKSRLKQSKRLFFLLRLQKHVYFFLMTTYVPGKQKLFPSYVFGQNFVSKQQIDKAASCLEIFNRSVQIFSQKNEPVL